MFISLEETKNLINEGKLLHIAADEELLRQLPKGNWIGGTTQYFITEDGGITSDNKLFVDEINFAVDFKMSEYDKNNIMDITKDAYHNGITILVIPFASDVAVHFSKEAPKSEDFLITPIVGWITGFNLQTDGTAKVYNGFNGSEYDNKAVALHINLPDKKFASIGIINIFKYNQNADRIEFFEDSLSVKKCLVNGKEVIFEKYITDKKIDTKLPLVSDYNGISINVSIKSVSSDNNTVDFYAPVFADREYRFADTVEDYHEYFKKYLKEYEENKPIFSCNCILNYLYGDLRGKATKPFAGPVTFGEVAYQLLNQTLVYAEIIE
ncbi:MAG: DUF6976 family protein [Acetivibrionales bacterium]|jgi:hypothetical protein